MVRVYHSECQASWVSVEGGALFNSTWWRDYWMRKAFTRRCGLQRQLHSCRVAQLHSCRVAELWRVDA
jgi:hypothetical protein